MQLSSPWISLERRLAWPLWAMHNLMCALTRVFMSAWFCMLVLWVSPAQAQPELRSESLTKLSDVWSDHPPTRKQALRWIVSNKRIDLAAALIHTLRFRNPQQQEEIASSLRQLTGERIRADWFRWMLWIETHPEVQKFAEFDVFLTALLVQLDPRFRTFVYPGMKARVRLEEIVWGGVLTDGIPALTQPQLIDAADATQLTDKEWVFGVIINGDVRAYPFRYMDWHEMLNDVVGGVPVSLAYCTLCGAGILFDTRRAKDEPFIFGSSGLLYRSNKLMYDQQTHSLWNQFTGQPVSGKLVNSDVRLPVLPLTISSWGDWKRLHPQTKVLGHHTGYERDYRPDRPYGRYFASDELMFPAAFASDQLDAKDWVFVLRISGAEKAWALADFADRPVIMDRAGVVDLVLVGDAAHRSVRAYRRAGVEFEVQQPSATTLRDRQGQLWTVTEGELLGPNGQTLPRLPGHLSFAFAFNNYFGEAPPDQ